MPPLFSSLSWGKVIQNCIGVGNIFFDFAKPAAVIRASRPFPYDSGLDVSRASDNTRAPIVDPQMAEVFGVNPWCVYVH